MTARSIAYLHTPHFAAALAQQAEPALAGRPFVLLDEQGRVLAADALAGGTGIGPGLSERQAVARCPAARVRPAARYPIFESQARLLERIAQYADRWQAAGLGCAYLDTEGIGGDLADWCQALGAEVQRFGVAPALGLTGSKFGAQVAGQLAGADTLIWVPADLQHAFLADRPADLLPLDADALRHLQHLGIRTLGQYAGLPPAGVLARFGPAGRTAQAWARGADDRPVLPPDRLPAVAARVEFDAPVADREILLAALMRRAARLLAPLQEQLQAVGRLGLVVTRGDGRLVPVSHVFPLPTAAAPAIRAALAAALDRVTWDGEGAAEATLTLADITDAPAGQLALFAAATPREELAATLARLAARYGPAAFRLATLTDPAHPFPERRATWRTFD